VLEAPACGERYVSIQLADFYSDLVGYVGGSVNAGKAQTCLVVGPDVMSGGVSVNEALLHVAQHDLPFGGVGASGMGHYHAREGFMPLSKLRPVFYQGPFSAIQMLLQPPYAGRALKLKSVDSVEDMTVATNRLPAACRPRRRDRAYR